MLIQWRKAWKRQASLSLKAVSASTLWGIKEGKLTLVDIVGEKKVIALPIGKRNIDKLCEELSQIKDVYGDKLK